VFIPAARAKVPTDRKCKPDEVRHALGRLSGMSMELKGVTIPFAFSAGWANHLPGESPDELLKRADDALYANKRSLGKQAEPNIAVQ
jgi:PleD family two-component response regulator